jgi:hypothetical protein
MAHDMNSWHSLVVDSPNVDNILFRNFCSVKTGQMTLKKKKKKRLIYCSEMYKCLHEFFSKTVPDTTSLHEISDLI